MLQTTDRQTTHCAKTRTNGRPKLRLLEDETFDETVVFSNSVLRRRSVTSSLKRQWQTVPPSLCSVGKCSLSWLLSCARLLITDQTATAPKSCLTCVLHVLYDRERKIKTTRNLGQSPTWVRPAPQVQLGGFRRRRNSPEAKSSGLHSNTFG